MPLAGLWCPRAPRGGGGHDPCDPPLGSATEQDVAERQQTVLERGQNESAVCTGRSRLRFVNVREYFVKRNEA